MQPINEQGFTIIELITVIVLLSILAVVAFGRLGSLSQFDSRAYYQDVVGALQYAQKLAVGTGCQVQVTFTSNSYALHQRQTGCTTGAYTRPVMNPAARGSHYQADAPDGVAISPALTFRFLPDYGVEPLGTDQEFDVGGRKFSVIVDTGAVDAL